MRLFFALALAFLMTFAWIIMAAVTPVEVPVLPVKISANARYFVDQQRHPIFWLGTTQWQLFRDYTLAEAELILRKTQENGFTFAQVMLLGVGDGSKPNVEGDRPWIDNNPLTPNPAYFKRVDAILQIAQEHQVTIVLTIYHQTNRKALTLEAARAWAKWLGRRYHQTPNLVWCMVPEAKPEYLPILRELAAGLQESDGHRHLITVEPDPSPYSSSFLHREPWLDFNSIQTWKGVELIYPMVTKDYLLSPVKPVLMAEGAYEQGSEYGFAVTPLWVRRQAYYSYLSGGHHTYGHNDSWRVLPTWQPALTSPGAAQMRILKQVFLARKEWWNLVPDQSIFRSGGQTNGQALNLAARHKDGHWIMAYMGSRSSVSIQMTKITSSEKSKAFWINPSSGTTTMIGSFPTQGDRSFTVPEDWEDALLILEAVR